MNRFAKHAAILILGAFVAQPVFAQGRHDEKPHGMAKPTQEASRPMRPATGGRHDEGGTTHGVPKAAAKEAKSEPAGASPASR